MFLIGLEKKFLESGEIKSLHWCFNMVEIGGKKEEKCFFLTYIVRAVLPGHFQVLLYQLLV